MPPRCLYWLTCLILLKGLGEAVFLTEYEKVSGAGWMRLHTVPTNWENARLRCNTAGDKLVSPTSDDIITAMKKTMANNGLDKEQVYVDAHTFFPEGVFKSIDGTPLENINLEWGEGEPDNFDGNEDCLVMRGTGELADVSCSSTFPYFCLKTVEKDCEATVRGYSLDPRTGRCYKFHRQSKPWARAEMICTSEHAHLAYPNSDKEAEVLKEIFAKYPPDVIKGGESWSMYIGGWDWSGKSNWTTIYGKTLSEAGYAKWDEGEPSRPGEENCLDFSRKAKLNDVKCTTLYPYICECGTTV